MDTGKPTVEMDEFASDSHLSQFRSPDSTFGNLDATATAAVVAATADIALVVGRDGTIRDMACGNAELLTEGVEDWLGQKWTDTVTVESRQKVEALMDSASDSPDQGSDQRWRQVNHPLADRPDLPIKYLAFPVAKSDQFLVLGRELQTVSKLQIELVQAQQAMEREYMRLRHTETRYRVLFQMASEAILIIDASNRRVVDANPAAIHLLGATAGQLIGQRFPDDIDAADREAVVELFSNVRGGGQAGRESAQIRLGDQSFRLAASLFRQGNSAHFLVRLSSTQEVETAATEMPKTRSRLLEVIEMMPDGFVVTDLKGQILTANSAFLDLAQLATEEQAAGQSLSRWLGRSDIDLGVLTSNLREHGVVRLFVTTIHGALGAKEEVEVSAVSVPNADDSCLGFAIRSIGSRQLKSAETLGRQLPSSVQQLSELVGHVSLKDLVRETTDMIERMSIEAALELTSDNRASAAELLGLSRQSLYAKLHRYGLGDLQSDSSDEGRD